MPDQQLTTHSAPQSSRPWHSVTAGFLGWMLDAFDFFVLVFLVDTLAKQFHVSKGQMVFTLTATLAMRPVGAVIFGLLADRYGRRRPLMANVIFFSVVELLCGFSPNYTVFLILRALYGIGMGGEWGVGASLAMEAAPPKWRGILSGVLQSGYPLGYLLAALAARFIEPAFGWRAMFWVGGAPALLALYIRSKVPESEAWKQHRAPSTRAILEVVKQNWKSAIYLVLMMTLMMFLSHGTQDLYPDFLRSDPRRQRAHDFLHCDSLQHWRGAGNPVFGHFSEKVGRRRSMICALIVSLGRHSRVGLRRADRDYRDRGIRSASRSAGCLGSNSRASERTLSGPDARVIAGTCVSTGNPDCRADQFNRVCVELSRGIFVGAGRIRDGQYRILIVVLALGKERKGRGFVLERSTEMKINNHEGH